MPEKTEPDELRDMSEVDVDMDTAYRSFGGEVEALSTPTICRLSDSRRHQLSAIARPAY
jgi:hypothetical protein